MMIMAFVGGKHGAQVAMAQQLARDLKGSFRVQQIPNNPRDWTTDEKVSRISAALKGRKHNGLVLVITGVSTQEELTLLRQQNATICISTAPLHKLFDENPIMPTDVFVCGRPGCLETPQKQRQYITPEEAFSACYSRMRGFKDVS